MILTFTDFGWAGPYVGQLHAVLASQAPDATCISLMHDAPMCNPRAAAYLLAAVLAHVPRGSIVLAVVDPGVGSSRAGLVIHTRSHVLVGPDNGLLVVAARRYGPSRWHRIEWRPEQMSASFHGRDWFAPVAARLATGRPVALREIAGGVGDDWPEDCAEIIYQDRYGNLMTGIRGDQLSDAHRLRVCGQWLCHARTFSDVTKGSPFWYRNSQGLVEIAANAASAASLLGAGVGTPVAAA